MTEAQIVTIKETPHKCPRQMVGTWRRLHLPPNSSNTAHSCLSLCFQLPTQICT
jgi:hypothetical protein